MPCESPIIVIKKGQSHYLEDVKVGCGKCPACKIRRVQDWVFRLRQEEKSSFSSYFVTLTYGPMYIPITKNGFMTLVKKDLQLYFKRLRKLEAQKVHVSSKIAINRKGKYTKLKKPKKEFITLYNQKIKYYACGEYGGQTNRPHYHIILLNVINKQNIEKAWTIDNKEIGITDIGTVTQASIAYTCKYIDKPKRIPMHKRDDRLKEFSIMSLGIGSNYITDQTIEYHHRQIDNNYIIQDGGQKHPLPKYYRDKIYSKEYKRKQTKYIINTLKTQEQEKEIEHYKNSNEDYTIFKTKQRNYRQLKFYQSQKIKRCTI